ncbi:MAG: AMP-binding protein [Bacteroidales bacterium]|nr:AMP-binding protein [Bacteroidales bacterium]
MHKTYNGLLLNNKIYPIDDLKYLCEGFLDDQSVSQWEKKVYKFILEWIDEKDYIIQMSSGTTGKQKKLRLSKESMMYSAQNTCDYFNLKFGQNALLCLPVDYIAGKMMIVRAFAGGLNLLLSEPTSMPDFGSFRNIDFCAMVPLQVYNSLNSVETLRRIKKLIIGGAEIRNELEVLLRDLPIEVYATYGMAEACSHVAIRRLSGTEYERYYHAMPEVKFKVDDRNCLIIEAKYLKDKIITNDVVDLVNSKKFRWIGRYDNLINSGGIKIVPEEVEAVISKSTGMDCAVIGLPDTKLGQKVVLILEKGGSEVTKEEIKTMLKNELPKHLQPREIIYVDELPRNHTFKVDRHKLIKQFE